MQVKRSLGIGRLLVAIYGVFAISATARALFQLLTKFEEAPLAYSLSAVSALVYIVATVSLAKSGANWRRISFWAVMFELIGVLLVGLLSLLVPEYFAHPSVWSGFGIGYGFVPLLLPFLGLLWLRSQRAAD